VSLETGKDRPDTDHNYDSCENNGNSFNH
jgi:hypothetical protein